METKECIEFRGLVNTNGYGYLRIGEKQYRAHRISYILFKGPIPSDLCVDHICRNRKCINPEHLRLLTLKENVLCGEGLTAQYKRRNHCKHGHALTEDNLEKAPSKQNRRSCLTCRRRLGLKYWHARKDKTPTTEKESRP